MQTKGECIRRRKPRACIARLDRSTQVVFCSTKKKRVSMAFPKLYKNYGSINTAIFKTPKFLLSKQTLRLYLAIPSLTSNFNSQTVC